MGSFILYMPLTAKQINDMVKQNTPLLQKWWDTHPDRVDCDAELWYGKRYLLKRDTWKKEIQRLAKEQIASDKKVSQKQKKAKK